MDLSMRIKKHYPRRLNQPFRRCVARTGDGQIKFSVHRTDLIGGAELRPDDSTDDLRGGFWSPSEYRLCVGCSGGTTYSWLGEFEDELVPAFTGMDGLSYGVAPRGGTLLGAAGTSK